MGLQNYTTLDPQDQQAANSAANYVEPAHSTHYNPGHNADTEVLIQPGTGRSGPSPRTRRTAPAGARPRSTTRRTRKYGGSTQGVQTGSSSKLFTLITALKQGVPFGFSLHVPGTTTLRGYTNCQGGPAGNSRALYPGRL